MKSPIQRAIEAIEQRQGKVRHNGEYGEAMAEAYEEALSILRKESKRLWITDKSIRPEDYQDCWVTYYSKDADKNFVSAMYFDPACETDEGEEYKQFHYKTYHDFWDGGDGGCHWIEFGKEIAWMPRDTEPQIYKEEE